MKSNPSSFNPAIEEQASLWAARLDGSELSPADRIALDTWLAKDPTHRELLTSYCQFSADLEQKLPMLAATATIDLPPARAFQGPRWGLWISTLFLGAAAAIAFAVWLKPMPASSDNVATPVGQRQSLTLADGTRVDLNAQTSLRIDLSGQRRHVLLASGEAFFAVHKDPSRPFIVETPAGSVRVTGTQFNVRTETTSALEVTVVEGSVQAHPNDLNGVPSAPHSLAIGDQLSSGPQGVTVRHLSPSAVDDSLAWRKGQVVFAGVPLREALARFARYHGRGITVSPDVAEKSVGSRFSLDDLDGFLSFIEDTLQVKVTREANGTVQVSARSPQ